MPQRGVVVLALGDEVQPAVLADTGQALGGERRGGGMRGFGERLGAGAGGGMGKGSQTAWPTWATSWSARCWKAGG